MNHPWYAHYPAGVPHEIDLTLYSSLTALIEEAFSKYRDRKAYVGFGKETSFGELEKMSTAIAGWLQSKGLVKGDRVALMMPNVVQYPAAIAGVLRAGMVVVNVNPLYTPRELEHQLKDSGAKAMIVLENFGHTVAQVVSRTQVRHIVVAAMGDTLGLKGAVVNFVVRHVKKMVPEFQLPGAIRFNAMIAEGERAGFKPIEITQDDVAFLQYTGGTTGISKGATLLHRNVLANVLQSEAWSEPAMNNPARGGPPEQSIIVCALPLYHIFALTVCCLLGMRQGSLVILIPNPRDLPALIKEVQPYKFTAFPAVNTLYTALANHPDFGKLDFSQLRVSNGGGMAVTSATARAWLEKTGCPIIEGYGLSETSPSVTCNPGDATEFSGTIGIPLPSTEVVILDDEGNPVPYGQPGEIAIRGPQVMAGYWQRPEETAKVMTADNFFKSGDVGIMDERGYIKIVDRKKDMILVSGFNVYPNEVEEVASTHPGVLEAAAVGVPDEKSGEVVKLFVVRKDESLTERDLQDFLHDKLTGYKRPKHIEFRSDLPKTNVGKILRRELRSAESGKTS